MSLDSEIERIRLLENRIRKKPVQPAPVTKQIIPQESKPVVSTTTLRRPVQVNANSDSRHSIDDLPKSKVYIPEEYLPSNSGLFEHSEDHEENTHVNKFIPEVDARKNKKITDFFSHKKSALKAEKAQAKQASSKQNTPSKPPPTCSPFVSTSPFEADYRRALHQKQRVEIQCSQLAAAIEALTEQNRMLRERLKQKDELYLSFKKKVKEQILNLTVQNHKYKHQELKSKVTTNRLRLGDFINYRESSRSVEMWIDGQEIRAIKEKLDSIALQREDLDKAKRNAGGRLKKPEEELSASEIDYRNMIYVQNMILVKEETHLKEQLAKLQQEKNIHIKEYKKIYEQQHSKYGRPNSQGIVSWPKINNFQLLGLLGKGGFSQVYKAFDTEELKQAACKIHEFSTAWSQQAKQSYVKHALRQNAVHKRLKHPNIVRLYNTVQIDHTSFCTVLEFCNGPDLSTYLKQNKTISEKQAKVLIKQVMSAIKYLHELPEKVIHYDLKPQNILFHNGQVKITDFGLCKIMHEESNRMELTSQGVGTYWYLPPECFFTEDRPTITTKVDIWSIGIIYYELLFGMKPFGQNMSQSKILTEGIILKSLSVNFPAKPVVSQESKDFIKACLTYKEDERPNIGELMNHPLFDKIQKK